MEKNKSILEKLIGRLEGTKQIENISDDFIKAIDFSITMIKHAIPVVEAEIEVSKQKGYNEALEEMIERFGKKE
jgi:hypothetical protein